MDGFSVRNLTFMLIIVLIWCSHVENCNARRVGRHWRKNRRASDSLSKKKWKNHHNSNGGKSKQRVPSPPPLLPPASGPKKAPPVTPPPPDKGGDNSPSSIVFNVLHFGAKGDGKTDDTKAFQATWAAACKVEASTFNVPSRYIFLVGPISFSGPYFLFIPMLLPQGGSGSVQGVQFSNIQVSEVQLPIVIDQLQ